MVNAVLEALQRKSELSLRRSPGSAVERRWGRGMKRQPAAMHTECEGELWAAAHRCAGSASRLRSESDPCFARGAAAIL